MRTVIGVGNPYRGDDAAGLEAARMLRGRVAPDVRVVECEGEPSRLLDVWADADEAIVLDAVRSGAPPGTLHHFDAHAGPLPAPLFQATSSHALGIAEAVELARALDRLPPRLELYGIEGSQYSAGTALAPAVSQAVSALVDDLGDRLGV